MIANLLNQWMKFSYKDHKIMAYRIYYSKQKKQKGLLLNKYRILAILRIYYRFVSGWV